MKSIQTKFIVLILFCVLLSSIVIGGAGVLTTQKTVDENSARIMNLLCSEKTQELNGLLSRIEQSVSTLAIYALEQLESVERLKIDNRYLLQYTQKLQSVAVNAASNTEGSMAVYIRYNPDFTPPTSGLFWSKTALNGKFQQLTPTDFSSFSPQNDEHVGWYYIPVRSGKAVWLMPYLNKNINVYMISYVVPLYMDNQVVGVVGMDIDLAVLTDIVSNMQIYDTGYAFLTDADGNIIYHRDISMGNSLSSTDISLSNVANELVYGTSGNDLFDYSWRGVKKEMAFRSLNNGMRLAITAPYSQINQTKHSLIWQIFIATVIIVIIATLLTVYTTHKLVKPLRELNIAAKKIANGDLSITLTHPTKDEVGTLSDSFQQTVNHLRQYIDYINGLAYRDALTGVKNKTAYQDVVKQMEERIRLERPSFALMVFDLNCLKEINDNYGHDFGDMLIIETCKLICRCFKHSPVFRIGGDEFVTILENSDLEHYAELIANFEATIVESNRNARAESIISIARGIAIFNSETDLVFANVFKRADDAMYQNKKMSKEALGLPMRPREKKEDDGDLYTLR